MRKDFKASLARMSYENLGKNNYSSKSQAHIFGKLLSESGKS